MLAEKNIEYLYISFFSVLNTARVVAIIQQYEPEFDLEILTDTLNLETNSDKTLSVLYAFFFPKTAASSTTSIEKREVITPKSILGEQANQIAVSLDITVADRINTLTSMFDSMLNLGPKVLSVYQTNGNSAVKVPFDVGKPKSAHLISHVADGINALASMFDSMLNLNGPKMPKFVFRSDGNLAVEMPFEVGQPKTTYLISQAVWSDILRTFVQSYESMAGHAIEPRDIKELNLNENSDIDSDAYFDSNDDIESDSSELESPMSPNTFHANMAQLLGREKVTRNLFNE